MAKRDWESPQSLLQDWHKRVRDAQHAHNEAAKRFEAYHRWLGIPVVVFSTIVGGTVFALMQKEAETMLKVLLSMISIIAAVLSGIQTFLGYSDQAATHQDRAARYGALRRRIEQYLTVPDTLNANPDLILDSIRRKLGRLSLMGPTVPPDIWKATMEGSRRLDQKSGEPRPPIAAS